MLHSLVVAVNMWHALMNVLACSSVRSAWLHIHMVLHTSVRDEYRVVRLGMQAPCLVGLEGVVSGALS